MVPFFREKKFRLFLTDSLMSDTLYGEGRPYPNLAHSIFGFRFSKYRNEISLKGWGTNTHYENMVFLT